MMSSYEYRNSSNHSTLNQHRLLFLDSITHISALSIEIYELCGRLVLLLHLLSIVVGSFKEVAC